MSMNLEHKAAQTSDTKALRAEIHSAQKEVERLRKNRGALFDVMSEMVFLIRNDLVIEYMNSSAIRTFGNLRGQRCREVLGCPSDHCSQCPVKQSPPDNVTHELFERRIGQVYVEYNYVAFQGYHGEQLVMIVMRDISQRKRQEQELAEIHSNIEKVLNQKIEALKESEQVRHALRQEVNVLKRELDRYCHYEDEMVGESRKFRELKEMINHVADSEATILITGESGTGKELVADIIHRRSRRKGKPFYKFNCARRVGKPAGKRSFWLRKRSFYRSYCPPPR
jgi:transcriptional regulator with PAS, ATPase and Fis domain